MKTKLLYIVVVLTCSHSVNHLSSVLVNSLSGMFVCFSCCVIVSPEHSHWIYYES